MQHRCVGGLRPVLAAQHPERQLGVVYHGRHHELWRPEPPPVLPGPLDYPLPVHHPGRRFLRRHRRRRSVLREGGALIGDMAEPVIVILLRFYRERRRRHGEQATEQERGTRGASAGATCSSPEEGGGGGQSFHTPPRANTSASLRLCFLHPLVGP